MKKKHVREQINYYAKKVHNFVCTLNYKYFSKNEIKMKLCTFSNYITLTAL